MNKILSIIIAILLCISVTACEGERDMVPSNIENSIAQNANDDETQNNTSSNAQLPEEDTYSNDYNNDVTSSKTTHNHKFSAATCILPKICSCGAKEGAALGHSFSLASCNSAKKCSRCGATEGSALGHDYKKGVCERCYAKDPNYLSKYSFGDSFDFDSSSAKVNISIGNNYSFDVIDNHYSEYYKKTVIKIPATIKNIDTKTDILNMYNVQMYNINGNRSPREIYNYFDDGEILYTQMRPGAKVSGYFYILYEGDGTYYIEFSSGNDNIEVELAITR